MKEIESTGMIYFGWVLGYEGGKKEGMQQARRGIEGEQPVSLCYSRDAKWSLRPVGYTVTNLCAQHNAATGGDPGVYPAGHGLVDCTESQ